MTITTIANITLLVAALLALVAMLRQDMLNLQQSGYSNSRYNAWLKQSGDISSLKRLLVLAVLIGTFTNMAMASWMVVMLLAAVLVALAVSMLAKRVEKPSKFRGKTVSRFVIALITALISVGAIYLVAKHMGQADHVRPAAMLAIMIVAITPLITMFANWLCHFFEKKPDQGQNEAENNTKE